MKGEQLAFVKDDGITLADGNTVTSHSFQTALFPRNIPSREITQLSPDELQFMATNKCSTRLISILRKKSKQHYPNSLIRLLMLISLWQVNLLKSVCLSKGGTGH